MNLTKEHILRSITRVLLLCLVCLWTALPTLQAQLIADATSTNVDGLSSTTTTGNTPAYIARNGGTMTGTLTTGTTSGSSSYGVLVETGGSVNFTNATITTTGANAHGLFVNTNGSITFSNANVTASDPSARGARVSGASASLTTTDVNFISAGGGVLTQNGGASLIQGGSITAGLKGIEVLTGSSVTVTGVIISSGSGGATSSHGAEASGSSSIDITGGSITTAGTTSHGVYSLSGSTITVKGGTSILTAGTRANGALATGLGSFVEVNGGTITTTGSNASGLLASRGGEIRSSADIVTTNAGITSGGSHGAQADVGLLDPTGTISAIHLTGGSIDAAGHGLWANGDGAKITTADMTSISTSGGSARYGAFASVGGLITIDGPTTVTTSTNSSQGLYARLKGGIKATDATVSTAGTASHAAEAEANSSIELTRGSLTASGLNAFGLRAIGSNAVITAEDVDISTSGGGGYGAVAQNGGHSTLTNGSVRTTGQAGNGLFANSGTIISSATVSTGGLYGNGLLASSGGSIDQTGGAVSTTGNYAEGLRVNGTGSRITNVAADVTTSGDYSHAATMRLGGLLEIRDSVLKTSGNNASGVVANARSRGDLPANPGETTSFANLSNVSIETPSGVSFLADEMASGEFTLDAVTAEVNNGLWLEAMENSALALAAERSRFRGAARTDATAFSSVVLSSSSFWELTGDSNLTSLQVINSEIDFVPAGGFKTLRTADYTGDAAIIGLNTFLGGDGAQSDRLVIDGGNASGDTLLRITNAGGSGAQTFAEGIKVVDAINGGSTDAGAFALDPGQASAYQIKGETAIARGAYGYLLRRGKRDQANGSDPYGDNEFSDDWYLRNSLEGGPAPSPGKPVLPPSVPLYSPGVPLYEAYPTVLASLSRLSTLQQRVGTRYWRDQAQPTPSGSEGKNPVPGGKAPLNDGKAPRYGDESGLSVTDDHGLIEDGPATWARLSGSLANLNPSDSTTGAELDIEQWRFQFGFDGLLHEGNHGRWIVGLTGHYGHSKADISSFFGNGRIAAEGYGLGTTATWYGDGGFYVDGQVQFTWFDSDIHSRTLRSELTSGNHAFGHDVGIEIGQRIELERGFFLVPQAQMIHSGLNFDRFSDPFGARVSMGDADQLTGRVGLALEHQDSWTASDGTLSRRNLYGLVNVRHGFDSGTRVDVSGVSVVRDPESTWGGVSLGITRNWKDDRISLYGEGSIDTGLESFGESAWLEGTVGLRFAF